MNCLCYSTLKLCFNKPTVIWTKQAALSRLYRLISSVHSTQFSLIVFARNSTRHRWRPGPMTTWQTGHSLRDSWFVYLTRWSAAQEHHRGLYSHHFLFTLYTSDLKYKTDLCHLQKYSDVSRPQLEQRWTIIGVLLEIIGVNWWTALWYDVETIISF